MRSDGGPAFPFVEQGESESGHPVTDRVCKGMSLRDWFAGQALRTFHIAPQNEESIGAAIHYAAAISYRVADAMLKAREVP